MKLLLCKIQVEETTSERASEVDEQGEAASGVLTQTRDKKHARARSRLGLGLGLVR